MGPRLARLRRGSARVGGDLKESISEEILLATFDLQLWEAAPKAGLRTWPDIPAGVRQPK